MTPDEFLEVIKIFKNVVSKNSSEYDSRMAKIVEKAIEKENNNNGKQRIY